MKNKKYIRDKAIRNITDKKKQEDIIKSCKVCHVGFVDGDKPYVLAFCFGYEDDTIYLHSANQGRKMKILKTNNNVCIEFNSDQNLFFRHEKVACSWRLRYRSVIAYGKAEIIKSYDEKIKGLKIFMKTYSDKEFEFSKPSVDNVEVIKIRIKKMSGRSFEYI